uniref:Uncharacterized protein n=1 Tax=Rousettus aegyptiacus TaxID=9407 RepID=A0A7J8GAV5_ROUAE|nr:hypothetical protein HJG63_011736 [Rousettus aegyptiacus]
MIECHVERGGVRRGGGRTRGCEAVLGSEVRTRNPARWISAPLALCFISLCIFVKILSALSGDPLVIIHRGGNNRDAQAPRQYSTLPQRPCSPRSPPDSEAEGSARKAHRRHEPADDSLPELDTVSSSPRALVSAPGVR